MLTAAEVQSFSRDGFLRIPQLFSPEQIKKLRADIEALWLEDSPYEGDTGHIRSDIMCRYPQFRWLYSHPPLRKALQRLLGPDFVYMHEITIHYARPESAWHKDTTSQEKAGHHFHWFPDYQMVQCAIYMQDNHPEYGGGISVMPGSHLLPDFFVGENKYVAQPKENIQHSYGQIHEQFVPTKAGDLTLFHLRTNHKATPIPAQIPQDWPHKLAIFFIASSNNRGVHNYTHWTYSRDDYQYLDNHRECSDDMIAYAKEKGLNCVGAPYFSQSQNQTLSLKVSWQLNEPEPHWANVGIISSVPEEADLCIWENLPDNPPHRAVNLLRSKDLEKLPRLFELSEPKQEPALSVQKILIHAIDIDGEQWKKALNSALKAFFEVFPEQSAKLTLNFAETDQDKSEAALIDLVENNEFYETQDVELSLSALKREQPEFQDLFTSHDFLIDLQDRDWSPYWTALQKGARLWMPESEEEQELSEEVIYSAKISEDSAKKFLRSSCKALTYGEIKELYLKHDAKQSARRWAGYIYSIFEENQAHSGPVQVI